MNRIINQGKIFWISQGCPRFGIGDFLFAKRSSWYVVFLNGDDWFQEHLFLCSFVNIDLNFKFWGFCFYQEEFLIWCLGFELYEWFWEHLFLGFIYKSIVLNFKIWGFCFCQEFLIRCCCFWVGISDFGSISFWVSFASPLFRTSKFWDSIFAKRSFLIRCLEIFNCDVWFWEHLFLICCCRFRVGMRDFGNIVICKNCFQLLDLGIVFFPRFLIFCLMCWWGVGVFELGWMKSRQLNIKKSNPILRKCIHDRRSQVLTLLLPWFLLYL